MRVCGCPRKVLLQSQVIYASCGDPAPAVARAVVSGGTPTAMCFRIVATLRDVDCEGLCSDVGFITGLVGAFFGKFEWEVHK